MESISDAAIELQQAVSQALALTNDALAHEETQPQQRGRSGATTSSNNTSGAAGSGATTSTRSSSNSNSDEEESESFPCWQSKRCINTFERKRLLRRVERAVQAFYRKLSAFRGHPRSHLEHGPRIGLDGYYTSTAMDAASVSTSQVVLDHVTLESLIDSITELPKLDKFMKSGTFKEIYREIIRSVSSIIQEYGLASLNPTHIDKLLDRVATLALQGEVDVDILQLINAALLHKEQMCLERYDDVQRFLATSTDDDHDGDHQKDLNSSAVHKDDNSSRQGCCQSIRRESYIILNAIETVRLSQLLIPLSFQFFSHPWEFLPTEEEYHDENHDTAMSCNKNSVITTWRHQHGGLQLRILLQCLLEHLMCVVFESNPPFETKHQNMILSFDNLKTFLFQLFEKEILKERHELDADPVCCDSESEVEQAAEEMVEDYVDLLTSFIVENVEFAIDAIDSSSHVLGQFFRFNSQGVSLYDDNFLNHGSLISRHVKDTVRLVSLACGLIELLRFLFDSFESHATKLLEAYAPFVAFYCNDGFLADVEEAASVSIDLADNVLFRLYLSTDNVQTLNVLQQGDEKSNFGKGSVLSVDSAPLRVKRRRIHVANKTSAVMESKFSSRWNKTAITTLLRAFSASSMMNNNDLAMEVIQRDMLRFQDWVSGGDESATTNDIAFLRDYHASIQACALSLLKQPPCAELNLELFSILFAPLVSANRSASRPRAVNVMNPWNYLISRSLMEKISVDSSEMVESPPPMRAVTVSSTSTVSDLRSRNTCNLERQIEQSRLDTGNNKTEKLIDKMTWFSTAFPGPINTLL